MRPMLKRKSSRLFFGVVLSSWLITACQAPQVADSAPLIPMPEAVVPGPSPVSKPPDDVVLQPSAPVITAPKPADNRELDRQIAQSYIDSARQKSKIPPLAKTPRWLVLYCKKASLSSDPTKQRWLKRP